MKDFTLLFSATAGKHSFKSGDKTSLEIEYEKGKLNVIFHFDFEASALSYFPERQAELTVSAVAEIGDKIELCYTPAHIYMYLNGELCDEEWGYGHCHIERLLCETLEFEYLENVREFTLPQRKGIAVEELRLTGVNVGDCMPFSAQGTDGRYHLFWLYDRRHHNSKWKYGAHQWAHASTTDLIHWDEHPIAIPITEQHEGSICTGSVICSEGQYYAWYAVRMTDGTAAPISLAISDDGNHFSKTDISFYVPENTVVWKPLHFCNML